MQITSATEAAEREKRLATAFHAGRIAGRLEIAVGLNPYNLALEPEEFVEWLRGRLSAIGERLARAVAAARRVA